MSWFHVLILFRYQYTYFKYNLLLKINKPRFDYKELMKFNRGPVYRRSIYPWYDTEWACIAAIGLTSIVLFFGIIGISVAMERYKYHSFVWLPVLITFLSGIVIIINAIRLVRKVSRRFSEKVSRIEISNN